MFIKDLKYLTQEKYWKTCAQLKTINAPENIDNEYNLNFLSIEHL